MVCVASRSDTHTSFQLKRECFTCGSRDPPSWRRSCLNHEHIVCSRLFATVPLLTSLQLCNRCGIYEKTHGVARPFPLDEIPNPPARCSGPAKKRKKSVRELGLKSLQITQTAVPLVNAVNVNSARGDEENSRAPSREESEDSEDGNGEDRRVSLNSNSK